MLLEGQGFYAALAPPVLNMLEQPPADENNALALRLAEAARWFEPRRMGVAGCFVYPLADPGVELVVVARCPGHGSDGAPVECGRYVDNRRLYRPPDLPEVADVKREMVRMARELLIWLSHEHGQTIARTA